MTPKQKFGAALIGLGAVGGIGVAIAAALKKEKPSRPNVAGLFSSENNVLKRRLGAKPCKPCIGG